MCRAYWVYVRRNDVTRRTCSAKSEESLVTTDMAGRTGDDRFHQSNIPKGDSHASGRVVRAAVVVPVHRVEPTPVEVVSLRQCGRVLGRHEIILLAPEGLDLGPYREWLPSSHELRVERHWMASRRAYNRLMIAPIVYDALAGYSHLLVHEPDAIVLRDELHRWCAEPYDYVGAPWFEGRSDATPDAPLDGAGNFGFSLRRVAATRSVLASGRRWYPFTRIAADIVRGLQGNGERLARGARTALKAGRLGNAAEFYDGNCDRFWAIIVPSRIPEFRVAPPDVALRFSWETLPRKCHALNGGLLPFGAHAWARYDPDFWLTHLEAAGVDLSGVDGELLLSASRSK